MCTDRDADPTLRPPSVAVALVGTPRWVLAIVGQPCGALRGSASWAEEELRMQIKELAAAMDRFRIDGTPEDAVLDAMVLFAFADGLASVAEMQYIGDLRFGGDQQRAFAAIESATERLRCDGDFHGALARISGLVASTEQREEVLAYAVAVAYADLEIKDEEDSAIRWLREALALPFSRTQQICDDVADAVESYDPVVGVSADLPLPPAFTRGDAWPGFRTRDGG